MNQLWHSIVDTIRQLPSEEGRLTPAQKPTMDEAIDKLSSLISLRRNGDRGSVRLSEPPSHPTTTAPSVVISAPSQHQQQQRSNTPIGTGTGGGGGVGGGGVSTPGSASGGSKRKRKTSFSISPAPPSNISVQTTNNIELGQPLSTSSINGTARSSTPMSREATGKHRRELYSDQLPLQPGRKVAFKLPANKSKAEGGGDGLTTGGSGGVGGASGGDDWILATVKRCLGDRMRYEVQDVDDGNAYNTTLRSIIPLPDPTSPTHLSSHPSNLEDFPRDSQVLALYPDTTSFYRATVISAPIPGTGNGLGVKGGNGRAEPGAKKGVYRLVFVDDDENVSEVQKDDVVAFPS
ncbi:hypothetical protein IAR55_003071 [Kwoniella newhampshirensis]|uniref:SGF29 C-terminal domain-containing protein n=1 Tax=Kwoniella newhampshirensis TaxID=1651941 RepID=A0AAW0YT82_9TREE